MDDLRDPHWMFVLTPIVVGKHINTKTFIDADNYN